MEDGRAMRLVYPLTWSRPGRRASEEQAVSTAAALARRGVDVTLLMPRPADAPRLSTDEVRAWYGVEGGFRLVQRSSRWAGEAILPAGLWLRQVLNDADVARADLLYSRMPLMLAFGGASPVSFATDHYKPWPDRWPVARPLFRRTARHPRCLGLVLHSSYAAASYRRLGIEPAKLLVAHNGAQPPKVRLTKAEARARLGLPAERAIAVYAGRLNAEKGLDRLLQLARARPQVLLLLVGSEGEGAVEREARAYPNVRLYPWQAPADLPPFLQAADLLLIPPSSAPLVRHGTCVLPMKLFAYLAAGRPILAPRAPDTAELLRDGVNALLVEPDCGDAAAAGLDRLLAEPGLAERLGTEAARLAGTLTWDARADKIVRFLEAGLTRQRSV
jgi:glycosyltransferase involved in cell wall biosynthesis